MTTYAHKNWGTFELDERTGLPALQEGEFWRVRKSSSPYYRVELRRRKAWFGSALVDYAVIQECELDRDGVLDATAYVLHMRPRRKPDKTLVGDYPPKTLNKEGA